MDAVSYSLASKQAQRIKRFIENPDSNSGVLTVPKVIASGETITIPAGRVAILPNVQIDGVLNVEGEVFIPSGATLGDLDAQLALKADTSYVNAQLSLKANTADLKEIGVGQTWQNVTRASGITYTNSTGKPIVLSVTGTGNGSSFNIAVEEVIVASSVNNGTDIPVSVIIPNNAAYKATYAAITIVYCVELR